MNDKNIKFIFFIIAILIIGFFFSSDLVPIKNFLFQMTKPISQTTKSSASKIGGFFLNIRSIGTLIKSNNSLEKENKELKAKLAQMDEINHENKILKQELGFVQTQNIFKLVPAKVVSRSPSSFMQTIKVDKGSKDGVTKGKAVLSNGSLLGIVGEVGEQYSDIILVTNTRSLIPIILQNSRGTGLLKGGLQGLTIEDIALDTKIQKDEFVVTSGLGGDLPSGILVGTVEGIISSQSEIFQRASVKSSVEFGKLEIVFIVI